MVGNPGIKIPAYPRPREASPIITQIIFLRFIVGLWPIIIDKAIAIQDLDESESTAPVGDPEVEQEVEADAMGAGLIRTGGR